MTLLDQEGDLNSWGVGLLLSIASVVIFLAVHLSHHVVDMRAHRLHIEKLEAYERATINCINTIKGEQ